MPMLANVLLRTQGKNELLVAATDLNVTAARADHAGRARDPAPRRSHRVVRE
jgi:hypothetical protein